MFAELVERLIDTDDDTLTARLRAVELQQRRLQAEQSALISEVDRRGLHLTDGHRNLGGYLRANLNWSDFQVRTAKKLATLLDTVAGCGDALLAGRIGVAQTAELARLRANPRVRER
ncbi:MAG: DUF222 domain-containing protein, partial [Ilumatobacter sp.]|nr:DUF222 domain-containing protein [Ilumatobacter sp.]